LTRKNREVEIPIPEGMQEAILALPVIREGEKPTTVGELVSTAHEALLRANETVQKSVLATMAAELVLKEQRKRGVPTIVLDLDGRAKLSVTYPNSNPSPKPLSNEAGSLPPLKKLREDAKELGVDISDLGRGKRQIIQRLEELKSR
jgi:hypothetical protein